MERPLPEISKDVFLSSNAKFKRAAGHYLHVRDKWLPDFHSNNPVKLVYRDFGQGRMPVLINPSVPLAASLIFGEFIHNLRGAFDHLTSAIFQQVTKENASSRVNFPSGTRREIVEFPQTKDHKQFKKKAAPLWSHIVNEIRPYKSAGSGPPADDLLWTLFQLNNRDKHRVLLTQLTTTFANHAIGDENTKAWLEGNRYTGAGEFPLGVIIAEGFTIQEISESQISLCEEDLLPMTPMAIAMEQFLDVSSSALRSIQEFLFP